MEIRKKGYFSDDSGNLHKELDQVVALEEENGFVEENTTLTKICGVILTIVCC